MHEVFRSKHVSSVLLSLPVAQRQNAVNYFVSHAQALPVRRELGGQQLAAALAAVKTVALPDQHRVSTQQRPPALPVQHRQPCAACKQLDRACLLECVLAPHFPPSDNPERFAAVHAAYGASNISTLLRELPLDKQVGVVATLVDEALALRDHPEYGYVGVIAALSKMIRRQQAQIAAGRMELERYIGKEAASAFFVPAHEPRASESMDEVDATSEAARLEMLRQAAADAIAGTSTSKVRLHERIANELLAGEIAKAKQLAAFMEAVGEPAADVPGSSSGATVAVPSPRPDQAAPVLVQQPPPSQAQTGTGASGVPDPGQEDSLQSMLSNTRRAACGAHVKSKETPMQKKQGKEGILNNDKSEHELSQTQIGAASRASNRLRKISNVNVAVEKSESDRAGSFSSVGAAGPAWGDNVRKARSAALKKTNTKLNVLRSIFPGHAGTCGSRDEVREERGAPSMEAMVSIFPTALSGRNGSSLTGEESGGHVKSGMLRRRCPVLSLITVYTNK